MSAAPRSLTAAGLLGLTLVLWGAIAVGILLWSFTFGGELGLAAVALPFLVWGTAMPFGLAAGLAVGVAAAALGRARWLDLLGLLALFVVPVAILALASFLIEAMAPHSAAEADRGMAFAALASPLSFVVYLAAWGVARAMRDKSPLRAYAATLALPLAASLAALVVMAASLAATPEYRMRGQIAAALDGAALDQDGLTATLSVRLDAVADFRYSALYLETLGGSRGMRAQALIWEDGVAPTAPGTYRLRLLFPGLEISARATSRAILFEVDGPVVNDTGYRPTLYRVRLDLAGKVANRDPAVAPMRRDGEVVFADRLGQIRGDARFDWIGPFHESGVAVARAEGKWGLVDESGAPVTPLAFEHILAFEDGVAAARRDGRWGYIDPAGRWVIPNRFAAVGGFGEGLAAAKADGRRETLSESGAWRIVGNDWGFVDSSGAFVIPPRFLDAKRFAEGLAPVRVKGTTETGPTGAPRRVGALWGYVDRGGRFVIEPRFDEAEPFDDGVARVIENGAARTIPHP